jgi:hypothetical protein
VNGSLMQRRRGILNDLVELRAPLRECLAAVHTLPWDSDVDLVVLARSHVVALLGQYLQGALSASDVESWANAVEAREDIGIEHGDEELLRRFVFETANPRLAQPISDVYARDWLERMRDVT